MFAGIDPNHPVGRTIVGVETRGLSSPTRRRTFFAVLVQGENMDVACYIGLDDAYYTALHGDKVSLSEAENYFPAIRRELAERGMTYRGPQ